MNKNDTKNKGGDAENAVNDTVNDGNDTVNVGKILQIMILYFNIWKSEYYGNWYC